MKYIYIDGIKTAPTWENLFWYLDKEKIPYVFDNRLMYIAIDLIKNPISKKQIDNICKFDVINEKNDIQVELFNNTLLINLVGDY